MAGIVVYAYCNRTFPTPAPPPSCFALRRRMQFLKSRTEIVIPPIQRQEVLRMKPRPQRARETRLGNGLVESVLVRSLPPLFHCGHSSGAFDRERSFNCGNQRFCLAVACAGESGRSRFAAEPALLAFPVILQ